MITALRSRLVEGSEVVPGGDLKGLRWQRGRGPRLGLGSRLPLLVHSGSLASWHRSKGGQGRSRPGCTGPVQRNTRSRGGGSVSSALYTYHGLVSVIFPARLSALSAGPTSPAARGSASPRPPARAAPSSTGTCPHLHSNVDTGSDANRL